MIVVDTNEVTERHSLLTIHSKHPTTISMTAIIAAPMHAKMPAMQDTIRLDMESEAVISGSQRLRTPWLNNSSDGGCVGVLSNMYRQVPELVVSLSSSSCQEVASWTKSSTGGFPLSAPDVVLCERKVG